MHRLGKGEPSTFPLLLEGPEAARNICMAVPVGKENKGKKEKDDQPTGLSNPWYDLTFKSTHVGWTLFA